MARPARRIDPPDLTQIRVARDPNEVLAIVDTARERQRSAADTDTQTA